jgi:hypothetical protein
MSRARTKSFPIAETARTALKAATVVASLLSPAAAVLVAKPLVVQLVHEQSRLAAPFAIERHAGAAVDPAPTTRATMVASSESAACDGGATLSIKNNTREQIDITTAPCVNVTAELHGNADGRVNAQLGYPSTAPRDDSHK